VARLFNGVFPARSGPKVFHNQSVWPFEGLCEERKQIVPIRASDWKLTQSVKIICAAGGLREQKVRSSNLRAPTTPLLPSSPVLRFPTAVVCCPTVPKRFQKSVKSGRACSKGCAVALYSVRGSSRQQPSWRAHFALDGQQSRPLARKHCPKHHCLNQGESVLVLHRLAQVRQASDR
jgi:hypothetical protein